MGVFDFPYPHLFGDHPMTKTAIVGSLDEAIKMVESMKKEGFSFIRSEVHPKGHGRFILTFDTSDEEEKSLRDAVTALET